MSLRTPPLALLLAGLAALAPVRAWASDEPEPASERPRLLHQNGYFQHALRLHSKITHVRHGDERRVRGSWVTGANVFSVGRSERVTQLTRVGAEIGGGGAGLDGALQIGIAHGWTLLPGAHTPFLRGAGSMTVQANSEYYYSSLQFPGLELGYQYASREWLFEIAGDGGLVVDGRYRVQESTAPTRGDMFWGGHLLLSFRRPEAKLVLMGRLARITDDYPVDVLDLRLCTAALDLLHACTTLDSFAQIWPDLAGADRQRRVIVTGISVGLGLPMHREAPP